MSLILLTVNDLPSRQLLREQFNQQGYRVMETENGDQCLEACRKWPVDLVVLEANSDAVNGYETCTRLHALPQFGKRPVLMLVHPTQQAINAALDAGADDYITMPLHPHALRERVEQLMDRQLASQRGQFAWLKVLFEQAQDGMFRSLPDGRYLEVNPALVKMLGYTTKEELYALDIIHQVYADPHDRQRIATELAKYGLVEQEEVSLKKKDGSQILASLNIHAIHDEGGGIRHYAGTVRELTTTRQMEETLRAILEVTSSAIGDDYFYRLVKALAGAIHASFAFVGELVTPDTVQTLAFWNKGDFGDNFRYALPGTPCETVINRNIAFYPRDVQSLFPNDLGLQTMGIESYFGAPIFTQTGKPLGIMVVMHDAELDILTPIRPLIQVFAECTGVEIERQRAHQTLRRRQELDLMINAISTTFINLELDEIDSGITSVLNAIGAQIGADRGFVFLYNASKNMQMTLAYHWLDEGIPATDEFRDGLTPTDYPWFYAHLKHQEILVLPRVAAAPATSPKEREMWMHLQIRSLIIVPLAYANRPIGFLGFDTVRRERDWSVDDISLLKSIGEVVTNTLVRQSAERAEREQRQLAEAIANIAMELNSGQELDLVLDDILAQLAQVIPYDMADIALIEAGISRVIGSHDMATRRQIKGRLQTQLKVAETENLRQMVTSREYLIIPDIQQRPNWQVMEEDTQFHGYLGVPIVLDKDVIGFVHLLSRKIDAFTSAQAVWLQIFASQIGNAIRNAWLFDAVQRHAIEMEQRVVERTLEVETQRQQITAILDSINEGVMGALDYDGSTHPPKPRTRYINPAMFRMLGYSAEEWDIYQQRSETLSLEAYNAILAEGERAVNNQGIWSGEVRLRRKDGTEFDAAITLARIRTNKEEAIPSRVMIVRDISQEKALAAQKSRFVVSAAHELRTPITNLKTRLYLAKKQPQDMDKHLDIISRVTETMHDLIEKLLDVSRFERGIIALEKQITSVQALVSALADVQTLEAAQKSITMQLHLPETPLLVDVDVVRINQVLTNLVANAINHTARGGTITLSARIQGNYVVIDVRDTGTGIKPEHLPHLFEPFYQVEGRSVGLGLGLSITKEIVELHQGEIDVQSVPEKGSCFSVWLPVVGADEASPINPTT